jgi:gliding motility-associated-like protein
MVSGGTGPYEYRWNTNAVSADSVITDLCPGDYQVVVVDAKGCESDPVVTEAAVLDRRFPCMDMRTVISPNGDGENDNFLINCIELTNDNRLLIFNQWGQLVYEAENYDNEWRGISLSGEALPEGAYYFIFEFTDNEGNFVQEKGSITLLLKE